jgi:hypothetical protein
VTRADDIDEVDPEDVLLTEGTLGYNILVQGEHVGAIEGYPGTSNTSKSRCTGRGKAWLEVPFGN